MTKEDLAFIKALREQGVEVTFSKPDKTVGSFYDNPAAMGSNASYPYRTLQNPSYGDIRINPPQHHDPNTIQELRLERRLRPTNITPEMMQGGSVESRSEEILDDFDYNYIKNPGFFTAQEGFKKRLIKEPGITVTLPDSTGYDELQKVFNYVNESKVFAAGDTANYNANVDALNELIKNSVIQNQKDPYAGKLNPINTTPTTDLKSAEKLKRDVELAERVVRFDFKTGEPLRPTRTRSHIHTDYPFTDNDDGSTDYHSSAFAIAKAKLQGKDLRNSISLSVPDYTKFDYIKNPALYDIKVESPKKITPSKKTTEVKKKESVTPKKEEVKEEVKTMATPKMEVEKRPATDIKMPGGNIMSKEDFIKRYGQKVWDEQNRVPELQEGLVDAKVDNTAVNFVNPFLEQELYKQNLAIAGEESRRYRAENPGVIKEFVPPSAAEKALNILANPVQAFGYSVRGEDMPPGLLPNADNNIDAVLDMVNPFAWANYLKESGKSAYQGDVLGAGLNLLGAVPGVEIPGLTLGAKNLVSPVFRKVNPILERSADNAIDFLGKPFRVMYRDLPLAREHVYRIGKTTNESGLTFDEVFKKASKEGQEALTKMSDTEFGSSVLKPDGSVIKLPGRSERISDQLMLDKDVIRMEAGEFADEFNSRLDLLNEIIQRNNKTGRTYQITGLDKFGKLDFYVPQQRVFDNYLGKFVDVPSSQNTWSTAINPGQWRGNVKKMGSSDYYMSIPGLDMVDTSTPIFGEAVRGTGTYKSINEYLKALDLGRVKPGFNLQTDYSRQLWENYIKSGKASGFYSNPHVVHGAMYKQGGMEQQRFSKEDLAFMRALRNQGVEVTFSKDGYRDNSPDRNNAVNIIDTKGTGRISMNNEDGTPIQNTQRVLAITDRGQKKVLESGNEYALDGDKVLEIPIGQSGFVESGSFGNSLFGMDNSPSAPVSQTYNMTSTPSSASDTTSMTGDAELTSGSPGGGEGGAGFSMNTALQIGAGISNISQSLAQLGPESNTEVGSVSGMGGAREQAIEGTIGGTLSSIPIVGQFYQIGSGIGLGFEAGANALYAEGNTAGGEAMTAMQGIFDPASQFGRNAELWEAGYISDAQAVGGLLGGVIFGGAAGMDRRVRQISDRLYKGAMTRATGGMHIGGTPSAETAGKFSKATGYPKPKRT